MTKTKAKMNYWLKSIYCKSYKFLTVVYEFLSVVMNCYYEKTVKHLMKIIVYAKKVVYPKPWNNYAYV